MSATVRIEESVQIARSPAQVWEAIADYGFDLQWRSGLVEMTPDPPGQPAPGTKVHEVQLGHSGVGDELSTRGLDHPGVSYRFAGEGTIGGVGGGRTVRPDPDGAGAAVFTYTIELQPKGGMRLLGPLLGPMIRSGLKKDLQKLKALLEADQPTDGA